MSADLRGRRLRLRGRRAETNALDELLRGVLAGQSGVLILRGEAGIGKSALLNSLSGQLDGWHVARAVGVESELELAYNGLHQICSPMLGELERLPEPQRDALATVFGLSSGAPPDRFMVGLATLTLLATVAQERPLACIVDDAQWLDQASAQIVAFVARRLLAERIAIVCAVRSGIGDDVLVGLPELPINRLRDEDARSLLLEYLPGPLDNVVRDQIIMESHGHPLALLELARGSNITALAGGFGVPAGQGIAGAIQRTFVQRLDTLPAQSRLFVLLAAAEPLGDPILLHTAGRILGLEASALDPAVEIGLVEVGQRVEFVHPLVRSAAYRTASREDLHSVHRALAEATDQERDPDRRAWHRARATPGRDEEVAAELERSSARAQARGGIGAAAAFLQRAVELTEDEARRSQRALAAAQMSFQAGAFDAALKALDAAEAGELDEAGRAQADLLRGVLAVVSSYGKEAVPLLLRAAKRLESIDLEFARRAYLTAWGACVTAGHLGEPSALLDICLAVRGLPPLTAAPHPLDLLLDGLALVVTEGRAAATPILQRAASEVEEMSVEDVVRWGWIAPAASATVWDWERYGAIFSRQAQVVRGVGALAELPQHLTGLAWSKAFAGDLGGAHLVVAEIESAAAATGTPLPPFAALRLRSMQGREGETLPLIEATLEQATAAGQGIAATTAQWAAAVLYNGLGRFDAAAAAAKDVADNAMAPFMSNFVLPELVEAATRQGATEVAAAALERLAESTQPAGTDWALGIEARCRALLATGDEADRSYREAIDRLGRAQLRPELARAHLLYGEWLRGEGRGADAREQLRTAHDQFTAIGMEAFAERARRELVATGGTVRSRSLEALTELTPQEMQIAGFASDGQTNPEIATQLFLSPRTVEWHLRKVFAKLGVASRRELPTALEKARTTAA